jgi:hypothetical protein
MQDDIITLPVEYSQLKSNLNKNKPKYMSHIYDSILNNIDKNFNINPNRIKLFNFSETNLVVIITRDHYKSVIDNLLNYYIKEEVYEKCSILNKIKNNIDLLS